MDPLVLIQQQVKHFFSFLFLSSFICTQEAVIAIFSIFHSQIIDSRHTQFTSIIITPFSFVRSTVQCLERAECYNDESCIHTYIHMRAYIYVYVCVCVRERKRRTSRVIELFPSCSVRLRAHKKNMEKRENFFPLFIC